jgi:hypothetical protein
MLGNPGIEYMRWKGIEHTFSASDVFLSYICMYVLWAYIGYVFYSLYLQQNGLILLTFTIMNST